MIKELIDDTISKLVQKEEKREKKNIWASDARKCSRKIYYNFKHRDKATKCDPRTQRIFDMGDSVHERICRYLEESGQLEATEVELPPNLHNITGRADAVMKDGTVVEIKSINVRELKKPIYEHVGQLQLYLYLLKKEKGALIYECKPSQFIFEFPMILDMDIVKEILKSFRKLQPYLLKSKVPPRDKKYKLNNYPCFFCEYSRICYEIENDE